MAIKPPIVPFHLHESLPTDLDPVIKPPPPHVASHNTAGSDPITALAGTVITTGTIDGDRLPAISAAKKGAVPATGAPAGHFLKDTTGLFEHVAQADVSGLEVAATPQFAGLGIKTAGGDNRANLIEGAIVGVATGPYQKYNAAAKLLEMLGGDVDIGNTPTQPGTGGTWAESYDSDTTKIYKLLEFNGVLYAAGGNGVYRRSAGAWARVLTVGSAYCHTLCIFNSQLYAFFRDTSYIYRTSNGTDWTNVTPVGAPADISASIVWNGVFYVSCPWGEVWYSTNGTSWTKTMATADSMQWGRGFAILGSNLYVAMEGATKGAIYKFNGTTWTRVLLITSNYGFQAIYTWNNKLYAGTAYGDIYSSANGTDWSAPVSLPAVGNTREFIEYSGKLLAPSNDKVYETSDGLTWTAFYDSPETIVYCFAFYGNVLYLGTSTGGKIYAYTDATYIPAPNLRVFGHSTLWGQLRPGDAPGLKGSLLMSDVPSYNKWLAPGVAKTYVAAPAVAGNDPIYQVIPASDVVNTPAGDISAINVQAAINELDTEKYNAGDSVEFADAKIGDVSNYTNFDTAGRQTAIGNARVLSELWIDAGAIKAPGAKPATEIAHGALETPAWQFSNEAVEGNQQTISFSFRVPLRMDISVAPTLCISWSTTMVDPGDDSVQAKWQLEYLWTSLNESTVAAGQETLPVLTSASTVAEGLMVSIFTGIDVPSATDICLHCRIKRLSADAQDTVDDTLELHGILLQFTSDKLGTAI